MDSKESKLTSSWVELGLTFNPKLNPNLSRPNLTNPMQFINKYIWIFSHKIRVINMHLWQPFKKMYNPQAYKESLTGELRIGQNYECDGQKSS